MEFLRAHYILAHICVAVAPFVIGIFVYCQQPTNHLYQRFGMYNLTIALWGLLTVFMETAGSATTALMWDRISLLFIVFIPSCYLHFAFTFIDSDKHKAREIKFAYVISGVFACLASTPLMARNVTSKIFTHYFTDPGPAYHIFLSYFSICMLYSIFVIYKRFVIAADEANRKTLKLFLIATVIATCGGAGNFLLPYELYIPGYLPFGTYGLVIYVLITAFLILKYQFLDIDVIVRRATVFAGLFAFVYGAFTVLTIVGQEVFRNYLGWSEWIAAIPTVLIVTFALRPLESLLTNITEKFLFQKKYDYRELLKTFTNEVLTVLDLQKLTDQTVIELNKIIKLESAAILLGNKERKSYKIASSLGLRDTECEYFEADDLIHYLMHTHEPILKNKDADQMQGHSGLRNDFKRVSAQLCLPIALHDQLTGVLCLGMKKSGDDYSQEDVDILMTLARTLSIAIANAQLFDQLSKTQAEAAQREKMAVIGTLAAGINHEICNPLGIVRGQCEMFLLNLRDGIYSAKSKEDMTNIAADIMNKVIKETDRATAITKKLSGFAKPAKKIDNEQVSIDKETDEVMGLLGHDLKLNNISFQKNIPVDFPAITADRRQIQEVLFNIIRNAAQAMDKKNGSIELSGSVVNDQVIIKIVDNGSGIPADKLGQIFNPFFTTKEPGKGTGLGLFIVKQVVERNKGTIHVDSQEGVGTTFTLAFPLGVRAKELAA